MPLPSSTDAPTAVPTDTRLPGVVWMFLLFQTLLGISLAVWLLTSPSIFRCYYPRLGFEPHLHDATAVVNWMSTNYRERSLNYALQNGQFIQKELKHYSAVRRVFQEFPRLTLALALLALLTLAATQPSREALASAERAALIVWIGFLLLLGLVGWWDWQQLFAWIHEPLFGNRSWRLPDSSYSLVLFPTAFWKEMAGLVLLTPTLLFVFLAALIGRCSRVRNSVPPKGQVAPLSRAVRL